MMSAKDESRTFIQVGAIAAEVDYPFYSGLTNGLCIVITHLTAVPDRVGVIFIFRFFDDPKFRSIRLADVVKTTIVVVKNRYWPLKS